MAARRSKARKKAKRRRHAASRKTAVETAAASLADRTRFSGR